MQALTKFPSLLAAVGATLATVAGCDISDEPMSKPLTPSAMTATDPWVAVPGPRQQQAGVVRGNLQFVEGYAQGATLAAQQRKPMLLFFTASWCHFCHQMAADAFTDLQVVNLSERFVCVLVDADAETSICREHQIRSFPTIEFVSANGQSLNRIVGKRPGHELVQAMHSALQALARVPHERAGNLY